MYDTLADVYDWLVPEALLAPEGSAAAFDDRARRAAGRRARARLRVRDRDAGGRAGAARLRGEPRRTRARRWSRARGRSRTRTACGSRRAARLWEELDGGPFDAVFCVGNSITHARDRRAALAGDARRAARRAVTRPWPRQWAARADLAHLGAPAGGGGGGRGARRPARARDVHVASRASSRWRSPSTARTHAERLAYWPFTHEELQADLLATGFEPVASTFSLDAPRYLVTSRANSSNASR